MIASWYDVLGVDDDASTDEIRAAWQEAVAGLDPTDRRFKQRNRAAEVLLDRGRRAAHDRELAAQDADDDLGPADTADDDRAVATATPQQTTEPTTEPTAEPDSEPEDSDEPTVRLAKTDRNAETSPAVEADAADDGGDRASRGPVSLVAALAVLAVVLLVATVVSLVNGGSADPAEAGGGAPLPDVRDVDAARKAAEAAVGPVLSYDYRDLDQSFAAAKSFMTPRYQAVYDQNVGGFVEDNAPRTKTIVTATVLDSGIVRTGEDRVDVLVFVNRPTRNASGDSVSRDQVTLRMVDTDGRWLVDCLVTAPGGTC